MLDTIKTTICQVVRDSLSTDIRFISEDKNLKPRLFPHFTIDEIFETPDEKEATNAQIYTMNINVIAKISVIDDRNNINQTKWFVRAEAMERLKRLLLTLGAFPGMTVTYPPLLISCKRKDDEPDDRIISNLIHVLYAQRRCIA